MNPSYPHRYKTLAVVMALTLTACGKTPEQHFQQAQDMVRKADYKAAVIELKGVLQEQPKNSEARLLLGKTYLTSGAYSEAEKELAKAREQGIADEQVLPALAKALLKQGQAKKVLDLAIPVSGLTPQSVVQLQVVRAEAFMGLGKRTEAEQALAIATQLDAQNPEALLFKARLALLDQKKPEAMQLIGAALLKDAKFIDALYLKAALLQQDKKYVEAAQVFQQIIDIDAKQFRARLDLSQLQSFAGKAEDAEKSLLAAEKIAGNSPIVKYYRGIFELKRGKLKEANEALQQVLKDIPDHLPSVLAQASVSYGLGNFEQSLKSAQRALAKDPNNLFAVRLLAASQLKTGDAKSALATLEPLLQSGTQDPQLLNLAAEIYAENKDFNKAMANLDRAVALDPKNPDLKTRQALGHLHQGGEKEALADLEKAVQLSDKPGKADFALVMLNLQRKQFDAALQAIAAYEKKLPNNPLTHNLRAAALLGKQDRAGARKELEQSLAIQPTFLPAAIGLARLDLQDKNVAAANKRFESVLAKDPTNLESMLALADLAKLSKQEGEYVKWLEKAVKAHPEAIAAREGLVRYYLAKNDKAKALNLAKEAVSANPDNIQALALLASVQTATGAKADSIAGFKSLVEKNPKSPPAYMQLAIAQLADNQMGPARVNLNKAIELKPDYQIAQDMLLRLDLAEKKPEAALQIARQMQQQYPKSPLGFLREGDISTINKNPAQAAKAYELALARDGKVASLIKLHRALKQAGNENAAAKKLTDWIIQHPTDALARGYAAGESMAKGRNQEAIAQYQALLKSNPNNVATLNNLAVLYQSEKNPQALPTAEQALKLAPQQPAVQDTLGWILVEQGQLPRGLDLLRQALAKVPKNASVRYHYAAALAKSGNKPEAKKELESVLASGQEFPEVKDAKALLKSL